MVDQRFHPSSGVLDIDAWLAGEASDRRWRDDARAASIAGAATLEQAGDQDVALAASIAYRLALRTTRAGMVIASQELAGDVPDGIPTLIAAEPHLLFVGLLDRLYPASTAHTLVPDLRVMPDVSLEGDVQIGPNAQLGAGVEIGRGTRIGANTIIGPGVAIGRDCLIGDNCTIICAYLGNRVVVHSGARIGSEGFGWLQHGAGNRKIPQLGRAILQDGVEIGANTTIDRGALGDTSIGEGTKIDNLVQVGHNCQIGRNCLIPANATLAGTTRIGDGVLFGVSVSTSGHLRIGRGARVMASSLVSKDVPEGAAVAGVPAGDAKSWRQQIAAIRKLTKRRD